MVSFSTQEPGARDHCLRSPIVAFGNAEFVPRTPKAQVAVSYPEIGSAPGAISKLSAAQESFEAGTRSDARADLQNFLDTFLGEMAALFTDAYMHHRRRRERR